MMRNSVKACVAAMAVLVGMGCAGRPSVIPNYDPRLRRTSSQFAADAAKRHPYKAEAPRGGEALGRTAIDYTFKTVEVLNYSDEDWDDVELWINKNYVVFVPRIEKGKQRTKLLNFQMFFDEKGDYFVTNYGKSRVDTLEMLRGGKMYTIKLGLSD